MLQFFLLLTEERSLGGKFKVFSEVGLNFSSGYNTAFSISSLNGILLCLFAYTSVKKPIGWPPGHHFAASTIPST